MLGRFQDLCQGLAFEINFLNEASKNLGILDRVLCRSNMIIANRRDNLIVAPMGRFFRSTSSAEETVGRSFEFRVVAAGGADYGSAVVLVASPVVVVLLIAVSFHLR